MSNCDFWWLVKEYHGSNCDTLGNTSDCGTDLWLHQGVSPNQHGNHYETLWGSLVFMDLQLENCRWYLILSGCARAIDVPQRQLWCMDCYQWSLLQHTRYNLLQHCIFHLATFRGQRKMWVIQTSIQLYRNSDPTTRLNDIHHTRCQCYPPYPPSDQCRRKQEQKIHQCREQAGGASWMGRSFVPSKSMKLNSIHVLLDLWYLTKLQWDVSKLWI